MITRHIFPVPEISLVTLIGLYSGITLGADWTMRGRDHSRNPVSVEKNAPIDWHVGDAPDKKNRNIRWTARLGTVSWGDPVVADGLVWVGTNNSSQSGKPDAGVLKCFRERDGTFLYEYISLRLKETRHLDWPYSSLASSPLADGDRLWFCTNRCEVICLDIRPLRAGQGDPHVLWKVDMRREFGVFPRAVMIGSNASQCSIAAYGDLIYVNTTNARDFEGVSAPDAPSLVCLRKETGKVVWQDNSPGADLLDVQHGSPLVIKSNGRGQVVIGQGDGWLRSFDCQTGELLWKFDINFKSPDGRSVYQGKRNYILATPVLSGNRVYIASGRHRELNQKNGRLVCLDVTKRGDISSELRSDSIRGAPNPNSGLVWEFVNESLGDEDRMHGSQCSVAVHKSLVIAPDSAGCVHCLDAETGRKYWTHDAHAAIWCSPLVVDDKVYVADEDGDVAILRLSTKRELIAEHTFDNSIECSPVFANGTLYITSRSTLYAVGR